MKSSVGADVAWPAPISAEPVFGNTSFGTVPPKFADTKSVARFPATSIEPVPVPTLFVNVTLLPELFTKSAAPVEV